MKKNIKSSNNTAKPAAAKADQRLDLDLELRRANRTLGSDALLTLLRQRAPDLYDKAEVVGKWVWITFPDKQSREVTQALSQFGFHWNNARQAWQHPCGTLPMRQEFDPRKRYGSHFASDQQAA